MANDFSHERKQKMLAMRRAGKSLAAIAIAFQISKSRVYQIIGDVKLERRYVRAK